MPLLTIARESAYGNRTSVTRDFGNGRLNQLTAIGYTMRFLLQRLRSRRGGGGDQDALIPTWGKQISLTTYQLRH